MSKKSTRGRGRDDRHRFHESDYLVSVVGPLPLQEADDAIGAWLSSRGLDVDSLSPGQFRVDTDVDSEGASQRSYFVHFDVIRAHEP